MTLVSGARTDKSKPRIAVTSVLSSNSTAAPARCQTASSVTASSLSGRSLRNVPHSTPFGIIFCSVFLSAAYFLRSSSIPTGLSSQILFLGCCASLITTFVYLWLHRNLSASLVTLVAVLMTVPSLLVAEDSITATTRWFGWLLIMAVVGPLFSNEIRLKLQVLDWTRKLVLVCTVGSLLLNIAGIRLSGRGMFFGLMGHTMILAPVSALAAIDLFCTMKRERSKWRAALLVICCVTCIGAGSRGAVTGLILGILTHVAHRREGFMVVALSAAALAGVGYVQADRAGAKVGQDLSSGVYSEISSKGANDTRGELWSSRISEFQSSPLVGIGFQQQHLYREGSIEGFIEPGSGYLAVLAMTGITGTIGFAGLFVTIVSSLYTEKSAVPGRYRDMLRGWTVFFIFHLIIEGYIFACGSLLCFVFWLTAGCSMSLHHLGRRKRILDRISGRTSSSCIRTAA